MGLERLVAITNLEDKTLKIFFSVSQINPLPPSAELGDYSKLRSVSNWLIRQSVIEKKKASLNVVHIRIVEKWFVR